jgi:VanZ family protein
MRLKITQFIPVIAWFIIANVLLLMPGKDLPEVSFLDLIYFDKWVHIGLFAGLTFLTALPFIKTNRINQKVIIRIVISYILYGILIEFVQKYFASDRSFDVTDMIADTAGCLLGYLASNWLQRRRVSKKNKPL